jgi:hypothetical protein
MRDEAWMHHQIPQQTVMDSHEHSNGQEFLSTIATYRLL